MDIANIVNGVNFKSVSNVVLDTDNINQPRYYGTKNVIFCKTDLIPQLFRELQNHNSKNILITHESDFEINANAFSRKPPCIVKWYAQNVNYQDPNLIPVPIGLENQEGPGKGQMIDLEFLKNLVPDYKPTNKIMDKIYCNIIKTHDNRPFVKQLLIDSGLGYIEKPGNMVDGRIPSREHHMQLSRFLFIASPRGNGRDCHRTWEALIMGSIPIVDKHFMFDTYPDLPIIQVADWHDLLDGQILEHYKNLYLRGKLFYNMEQLTMDYWKKRIKQDFDQL
jgi:hypothetical protein